MKESHVEGLASHNGPESCAGGREAAREALTGVRTGRVLSREKGAIRVLTPLLWAEGDMDMHDKASAYLTLRGRRPLACAKTPCARTGRSCIFPTEMERRNVLGRSEIVIQ